MIRPKIYGKDNMAKKLIKYTGNGDIPIIGAPKIAIGGNYDDMDAAGKKRIDDLFKKYPLQPKELSASISEDEARKLADSLSGEDGKRILSRMVVAHPDLNMKPADICKHFWKDMEMHAFRMGYEIDTDFPRFMRAHKDKNDPFGWIIFCVLKKDKFNPRDVHFGEKGMDLQRMSQSIANKRPNPKKIIKGRDFTKL
jgi:hypothetical protein